MDLYLIRGLIYFLKIYLFYGGESRPYTLKSIMNEWPEMRIT